MPMRELGALRYIIFSSPFFEKRRIKSARPQEKRQEDRGVLFIKTEGCPSGFLRSRFSSEEKLKRSPAWNKASRINLESKTSKRPKKTVQENSSVVGSRKLVRRELRSSLRGQHSWKNCNCRDNNLKEGGQCYARVELTP